MCDFFSIVTNPDSKPNERFYFDWAQRVDRKHQDCDSHSTICKFYALDEDKCNKYEYDPLTAVLIVDQINNDIDDRVEVEAWLEQLDWKRIVEPLIVKEIVHPLKIEAGEVTEEVIEKLHHWASVRASVGASVWDSAWASVGASVWASVRASVWAYMSSFFDIKYEHDYSSCVQLWEHGFVPSFDGKTWRLHAGKNADVVYEWTVEDDNV